ncbi:hypothetical protein BTA51_08160 [Hahella sp. CCB-MM4]|uniref:motility associated factor glycosyltransferase family protein n=1 Tax=Hahella sp. (strain CCB-MM4) TaxID=1926491 RepID=UPI000BDDCB96|nr:6-hydroxymethylpterin diphosphokinase MptE-like protein [Hahella sp. CCB-MM4]OZG73774.1 hypothetical protein BTA51_08160 [Hahella sp. CCB-MM4]
MTNPQQLYAPFLQRREKNLAFFKKTFPGIYEHFAVYKMQKRQVNIDSESGNIDLLSDGRLEYGNQAKEYARNEVKTFQAAYSEGRPIASINPPMPGDYAYPRYAQMHVDSVVRKSPLDRAKYRNYPLENFYPLVVFLGSGLGYQIEEMILEHNVQIAVVVEPDMDKFAASLYAVDWEVICKKINARHKGMIHFIIGAEEDPEILWAATWNKLIMCCPQFPITTLFYNHQGRKLFDEVSDRINHDLFVFLLSWGHYDDEIRQMNNALHNFHRGIKKLPRPFASDVDFPVCIVGAGPSLNDRIEVLREMKDRALIISCGTALKSLHAFGLTPDIHIELESDLNAYIALMQIGDPEFLKSTHLIGPSQISPLIYQAFGESRMYFKSESALANLFSDGGVVIKNATPTCTNAGVAIALHMGFRKLFFFGLDYGFKDKENHHAKGSLYYENLMKKNYHQEHLTQVDTVDGGKAWSTPNYFTSKRKLEQLLKNYPPHEMEIYSCSDTAVIEGSKWINNDEFREQVSQGAGTKADYMNYLFSAKAKPVNLNIIHGKLRYLEKSLEELHHDLKLLLDNPVHGLEDMSLLCFKITGYLESVLQKRTPDFYYFTRGAVRHFLYAGYTHYFALQDPDERAQFYSDWKKGLLKCFAGMPAHFRKVAYKKFDIDADPWIKQGSRDAEDGVNPYFVEKKGEQG